MEPSAAAGNAIRRTTEDGSSRLPGARPGASFSPTIARPSAGMASSTTAVERMTDPSTRSNAARLPYKITKLRGRNCVRQRAAAQRDRC